MSNYSYQIKELTEVDPVFLSNKRINWSRPCLTYSFDLEFRAPIPHMVDFIFQKSKNLNKQQYFTDNHYE